MEWEQWFGIGPMSTWEQLLVGAIIGAVIGWAVAYIQHRRTTKEMEIKCRQILSDIKKLYEAKRRK